MGRVGINLKLKIKIYLILEFGANMGVIRTRVTWIPGTP